MKMQFMRILWQDADIRQGAISIISSIASLVIGLLFSFVLDIPSVISYALGFIGIATSIVPFIRTIKLRWTQFSAEQSAAK